MKIKYKEKEIHVEKGMKIWEVLKDEIKNADIEVIAAKFNNEYQGLDYEIEEDELKGGEDKRQKLTDKVTKVRKSSNNSTDKAVDLVGKLPKFIRDIAMGIFLFMDKHDILPKSLCEDNIYYSSVLVSNIGSLGCGAIYHNLTDFGTNSILVTIGNIHKEQIVTKEGKKEIRDICEFGINLDERIADGFYFIKSIQLLEEIFNNPEKLEEPANSKIKD